MALRFTSVGVAGIPSISLVARSQDESGILESGELPAVTESQ
jgi:hypothetical protein